MSFSFMKEKDICSLGSVMDLKLGGPVPKT